MELGRSMGIVRPLPILWFEPSDLLTATGTTPIRAMIDNSSSPVDPNLIADVAAQVELREYPSLNKVSVSIVTHAPKAGVRAHSNEPQGPIEDGRGYVDLQPNSPLADSWYVLSLRQIPKGVRVAPWGSPTPIVGAYSARFHTGSHPVLTRTLFCDKLGMTRTILEFSENVSAADAATAVRVQQGSKVCKIAASGPIPAESMKWISLDCPTFDRGEAVQVGVQSLHSPTGAPVVTFSGEPVDREIGLTSLPEETGCKMWSQ